MKYKKDSEFEEFLKSERYCQTIDGDADMACPCGGGEVRLPDGDVNFRARCWRVSDNPQDLYVWGDHPKIEEWAAKIKENLDAQEWYNPYTIIYQELK